VCLPMYQDRLYHSESGRNTHVYSWLLPPAVTGVCAGRKTAHALRWQWMPHAHHFQAITNLARLTCTA
jgi:hypothetical protein